MSKKTKKVNADELVMDIKTACASLGWVIAIDESRDTAKGLIIGTLSYVEKVIEEMEDGDAYQIWADPSLIEDQVH